MLHFEGLAATAGVPVERVTRIVRDTVQRAMATWPAGELDPGRDRALRAHAESLPLLEETG